MALPTMRLSLTLLQFGTAIDPACCCQRGGGSDLSPAQPIRIGFTSDLDLDLDDLEDEEE